jgi:signal transduction histidine kinase
VKLPARFPILVLAIALVVAGLLLQWQGPAEGLGLLHFARVTLPRPVNIALIIVGLLVLLLWLSVLRFAGSSAPRGQRWTTLGGAACLAGVVAIALLDPQPASAIRVPWDLLCAVVGAWSIAILVGLGRRSAMQPRSGVWAIMAAALITLALGLTDLTASAHLLPFGAPVLLCALVYAVADGYFRTRDEVRSLNADLAGRGAERALERVTTLAGERERLMRDMHDGIGSQLVTTLQAVERGGHSADDVAVMLRDCVDDLRLIIDSLEPDDDSLLVALANLRYRLEPRVAAAGIALDWQAHRRVVLPAPGSVLQVLRIVQEAVSNVLKHAGASRLRVCARAEAGDLVLEVEDDGRGIGPAATPAGPTGGTGRGLDNMRSRAAQLGGTLHVSSTAAGTLLTLRVPMAAQPGPA